MLTSYQTDTLNLLQAPAAPSNLYTTASLTRWINQARHQTAGEGECVRAMGTISVVAGTTTYPFSGVTFAVASSVSGVSRPFHVRSAWVAIGDGQKMLVARPFQWFANYYLNQVVPTTAPYPSSWAQYGQGVTGSLRIYPTPTVDGTLSVDCVCDPIDLVDDTTVEALPYPWTDAVPYYAAYLALLSAQTGARQADANRMFQLYAEFVNRARKASTPSVLPYQFEQSPSLVRGNQLGVQPGGQ